MLYITHTPQQKTSYTPPIHVKIVKAHVKCTCLYTSTQTHTHTHTHTQAGMCFHVCTPLYDCTKLPFTYTCNNPVSGDRFIEEKTLLLAVRSYVFFSQLSAWLSASHDIHGFLIISAADEELIWNFSQTPSEHAFPVPNVSHSVALKVRVQSLPRQPKYPVLKCSIHSGLTFLGKRTFDPGDAAYRRLEPVGDPPNPLRLQGSPLFCRSLHSPLSSPLNPRKCPQRPESPVPPNKAVKWLYSRTSNGLGVPPSSEVYSSCTNGAESLLKSPPHFRGQEVIARIAQRLNFCDPTAPHLPDALFSAPCDPLAPKTPWNSSTRDEGLFKKTKDPSISCPIPQTHERTGPEDPEHLEPPGYPERSRTSLLRTPLSPRSRARGQTTTCRRLLLTDPKEGSLIAEAVQDISRLIQERLQQSQELLHSTYKLQKQNYQLSGSNTGCASQANGIVFPPHPKSTTDVSNGDLSTDPYICTDARRRSDSRSSSAACSKPEEPIIVKARTLMQTSHQHAHNAKNEPWNSFINTTSPKTSRRFNGAIREEMRGRRGEKHSQAKSTMCGQNENQDPWASLSSTPTSLTQRTPSPDSAHSSTPCSNWKKQNRHSIDGTATKAFHPCTDAKLDPLLSFSRYDLSQLLSASAPPASLSLLGNFEECVLNYRLEPLGTVEGFTAEVGASGSFCPSHMTFPVDVSFYSVSDDNAPSPYMGVINLESLGKRGYRVPPSGTIQVTLFNPNKTVVKMFVVMYDLREMPSSHQTFLRQRTFSVPVKRESNGHNNKKPLTSLGQGRTLRYLIHLRFQSSKSGKIYLHRDIRLLGAAYELKSFTESPADPPFSARC
uniref:Atos homolog protein A n=1 Tax=Astyanax mexicanus TaxID=7994 RepID=A0A3B1KJC5_ASTMX